MAGHPTRPVSISQVAAHAVYAYAYAVHACSDSRPR